MAKSPAKYQVYGLKENYIGTGQFGFKIVISPRFKSGQDFAVNVVDSDRVKMKYQVQYWGRKLNIIFQVSKLTPDGLATCYVIKADETIGQFNFWVIK